MKTLLSFALLFATFSTAHAADVTLECSGQSQAFGKLQKIEWSRDGVIFTGVREGGSYSIPSLSGTVYGGNGYAYKTAFGDVIIPFGLINGAAKEDMIQISSVANNGEFLRCSRD
jgi:hypothetical protein